MTGRTKKYTVKTFDASHIPHLVFLYREVFNIRFSEEQVLRKYFPAHLPVHAQGHLAFHEGKPVAFHGAIPGWMQQGEIKELAAQSGDAMTLSNHQRQGLFTELGERTYASLAESGITFTWGFPNQNSEYGYLHKLQWVEGHRMRGYNFKIKGIPTEMISRKLGFTDQSQERIQRKLEPIISDSFVPNSATNKKYGGILRDEAFYKSRNFTPNYHIQLGSDLVWIKTLGGLMVGDLTVIDEHQILELIDKLKTLARQLGLRNMVLQASPGTKLDRILNKHFPAFDSWLYGYRSFGSQMDLAQMRFTFGDLDTF